MPRDDRMSEPGFWLTAGALCGLVAVAFGAFGAHALRDWVVPDRLAVWSTATQYLGLHALALIACGLWMRQTGDSPWVRRAAVAFLIGVSLFSGSLFALVLADAPALGAVTPLGGVSMLAGWVFLVVAAQHSAPPGPNTGH